MVKLEIILHGNHCSLKELTVGILSTAVTCHLFNKYCSGDRAQTRLKRKIHGYTA